MNLICSPKSGGESSVYSHIMDKRFVLGFNSFFIFFFFHIYSRKLLQFFVFYCEKHEMKQYIIIINFSNGFCNCDAAWNKFPWWFNENRFRYFNSITIHVTCIYFALNHSSNSGSCKHRSIGEK